MNKILLSIIAGIFVAGIAAFALGGSSQATQQKDGSTLGLMTVYKSMQCGCCGIYAKYLESNGARTDIQNVADPSAIKQTYSIPPKLQSCHTTIVGPYFVEGHIPLEAIRKLMNEKPDIAGIAMPGMPSGSPGMPGAKTGPFVIYAVDKDGSQSVFMTM